MVQSLMSMEQLETISELLRGADWALAHGDLGTLGAVADKLTAHVASPLQRELRSIASEARLDPDHAISRWVHARATLHEYLCDRAEGV
jgi:hypothetical protein